MTLRRKDLLGYSSPHSLLSPSFPLSVRWWTYWVIFPETNVMSPHLFLVWGNFSGLQLREASGFCSSFVWHRFLILWVTLWPVPHFWKTPVVFLECSFNLISMILVDIINRWRTVCHQTRVRYTSLHRKASIGISERLKNVEESCSSSAIYLIWVLSKRDLFPTKQYWAINVADDGKTNLCFSATKNIEKSLSLQKRNYLLEK